MIDRKWTTFGSWLFVLGWALIIAYSSSPLWQGTQILNIPQPENAGTLISEHPGGEAFAAHQKTKPGAGDIPRIIPLPQTLGRGYIVVLSWNYGWSIDTRWSPGLLQYDGQEFRYAAGEQTPSRTGKAGGKPVPTTRVMRLPFLGSLDEHVYALEDKTRYFVLLPQNAARKSEGYNLQLRNRMTGAEQPSYLLLLGLLSFIISVPVLIKYGKKQSPSMDPVDAARTYTRWKRYEQARQFLRNEMYRQPSRLGEFEAVMREIDLAEKSSKKKPSV